MVQEVHRDFSVDFIYLDLMLVTVWIALLLVRKRFKQLLIGLFGYSVTHFTDAVLWYTIRGTRHIEIENDVIGPHIFLTYFSFTYGMIMFSFAVLMFDKKIHYVEKILFAILMWGGWLVIGTVSQAIHWNDLYISIYREMADSRLVQGLAVVLEFSILIIWKSLSYKYNKQPFKLMQTIPWRFLTIVFATGVFIHFSMESTLMIAGIRPIDWGVMTFNSLIEFNTGAPILFLLWVAWNWKDYLPKPVIEIDQKLKETISEKIEVSFE